MGSRGDYVVAGLPQSIGHLAAGREGNVALLRLAPEQDDDPHRELSRRGMNGQ